MANYDDKRSKMWVDPLCTLCIPSRRAAPWLNGHIIFTRFDPNINAHMSSPATGKPEWKMVSLIGQDR